MLENGLQQVDNPSMMLLSGRPEHSSGTCVTCIMEGSRPILAEIQALAAKSSYPVPRRTANGFDFNRIAMLIAVMEKRCGFSFGMRIPTTMSSAAAHRRPFGGSCRHSRLAPQSFDKPIPWDLNAFEKSGLPEKSPGRSCANRQGRPAEWDLNGIVLPKQNAKQLQVAVFAGRVRANLCPIRPPTFENPRLTFRGLLCVEK
jgi:DNA repair protein RadA/Sms